MHRNIIGICSWSVVVLAATCVAIATDMAAAAQRTTAADIPADKPLATVFEELLPGINGGQGDAQQRWQRICFSAGAPGNEAIRAEVCKLMCASLGPQTPAQARVWLIRQLEHIGRGETVDALAAALSDPDGLVADAACRALANNPAAEAGAKLRDALQQTTDAARRVALVCALGYRAEPESVAVLAKHLGSADVKLAVAAAQALGRIATPEAAAALGAVHPKTQGELRLVVGDAYLRCADRLLRAGKTAEALAMYKKMWKPDEPARLAALRGMLAAAGPESVDIVIDVLRSDDPQAHQVAIGDVIDFQPEMLLPLANRLDALPVNTQAKLLAALGTRREVGLMAVVLQAAKSEHEPVRLAALRALGSVGDASVVPTLLEAIYAGGQQGAAAREALEASFAKGVDDRLVEAFRQANKPEQQATIVEILDRRRAVTAMGLLLELAAGDNADLRRRAFAALARLAGPGEVPPMIQAMLKLKDPREREDAEKAIAAVCGRISEPDGRADPVLAVYHRLDSAQQISIMPLIGRIGGSKSLKLLRQMLAPSAPKLYDAAAEAICNWPDAQAAEDMLHLASSAPSEQQRVRAVRAVARVAVLQDDRPDAQKLDLLKRAMKLATRNEDRALILDRAASVRHIDTLRFAVAYLDDPVLAPNACRTVVELAHHRGLRDPNKAEFAAALRKVIAATKDDNLAQRAKKYLGEM